MWQQSIVILVLEYCTLLGVVFSKINKLRPLNGKGHILISSLEKHNDYNENKLMVQFSLECLQSSTNDDYETILNDKMVMFESKYPCLKHDDHKHFKQNNNVFSFLNIDNTDSVNETKCIHDINNRLDYNEHCVDMFLHEPVFQVTSFGVLPNVQCTEQDLDAGNSSYDYWGLDEISKPFRDSLYAYPSTLTTVDNGVDLIVVDSGVLDTHDEFNEGQIIHRQGTGPSVGYNFVTNETLIESHGTHVSGIAAGINYGVSKGTKVYDYAVCIVGLPRGGCPGYLIWSAYDDILQQLREPNGVFHGRRVVINFSVGGGRSAFDIFEYYFKEIHDLGGIIAVAAGNSADHSCDYAPAFTDWAISVGAYDSNFTITSFSNHGECNDVYAPGEDIYSATADCDDCYESWMGTSMASPYIAGIMYNLLYVNPTLTLKQIKTILYTNTWNVTGCTPHESGAETCWAATYVCQDNETYENIEEYEVVYEDLPWDVYIPAFNDKVCSTLVIDTYVSHNNTFENREFVPVNMCVGSREITDSMFYGTESAEWGYMYQCNYDANTIDTVIYPSKDCSDENSAIVIGTIADGDFDGKFKYFVDCNKKARQNDGVSCGFTTEFVVFPEVYNRNCTVNESFASTFDQIYMNGFCMSYYGSSFMSECVNGAITEANYEGNECDGNVTEAWFTNGSDPAYDCLGDPAHGVPAHYTFNIRCPPELPMEYTTTAALTSTLDMTTSEDMTTTEGYVATDAQTINTTEEASPDGVMGFNSVNSNYLCYFFVLFFVVFCN